MDYKPYTAEHYASIASAFAKNARTAATDAADAAGKASGHGHYDRYLIGIVDGASSAAAWAANNAESAAEEAAKVVSLAHNGEHVACIRAARKCADAAAKATKCAVMNAENACAHAARTSRYDHVCKEKKLIDALFGGRVHVVRELMSDGFVPGEKTATALVDMFVGAGGDACLPVFMELMRHPNGEMVYSLMLVASELLKSDRRVTEDMIRMANALGHSRMVAGMETAVNDRHAQGLGGPTTPGRTPHPSGSCDKLVGGGDPRPNEEKSQDVDDEQSEDDYYFRYC